MTQHLSLVGLSNDRSKLLLVDDAGAEFTLDIDPKLRAALRGEHARIGQLEIEMDSVLRPRDIQARIRAGESPETVAAAAKTTVEKIMPFAAPVLAEREHIADRAQRSSLRRPAGEGDGSSRSRTLGDAVEAHLRARNLRVDTVTWDSYRREDGRWVLTGDFATDARQGSARFAFDAPGNFVVTENDDARWLVGDLPDPPAPAEAAARPGPQRRLAAVPQAEELPLGDDAIELVRDDPSPGPAVDPTEHDRVRPAASAARSADTEAELPPVRTVDLTETAAKVRAMPTRDADTPDRTQPSGFLDTVLRSEDEEPVGEASGPSRTADQPVADSPDGDAGAAPAAEEAPARRPARKKGRASVPSWDEIMFGGGKGAD